MYNKLQFLYANYPVFAKTYPHQPFPPTATYRPPHVEFNHILRKSRPVPLMSVKTNHSLKKFNFPNPYPPPLMSLRVNPTKSFENFYAPSHKKDNLENKNEEPKTPSTTVLPTLEPSSHASEEAVHESKTEVNPPVPQITNELKPKSPTITICETPISTPENLITQETSNEIPDSEINYSQTTSDTVLPKKPSTSPNKISDSYKTTLMKEIETELKTVSKNMTLQKFSAAQKNNAYFSSVISSLETNASFPTRDENVKYQLINGLLFHADENLSEDIDNPTLKLLIPPDLQVAFISVYHKKSHHSNAESTTKTIKKHFHFHLIDAFVTQFVNSCENCSHGPNDEQSP